MGFSVMRPCRRAVWSPRREAIHAWAHSCTLSEKMSSTNLNKAMRRKVCDTSAPKYRKPQVTIRSFPNMPLPLLGRKVSKDRVRLNLLPGEHNRVTTNPRLFANLGSCQRDMFHVLIQRMRVNAGKRSDHRAFADFDATSVIQNHALANLNVILDRQ